MSEHNSSRRKPDDLNTIIRKVEETFADVTQEEIDAALARSRGTDEKVLVDRRVIIDGEVVHTSREPDLAALGKCSKEYAQKLRDFVDGVKVKREHREKKKKTREKLITDLRKAIRQLGRDAKPDAIIRAAEVNEQDGRDALRELEAAGDYEGFARRRPRRYSS